MEDLRWRTATIAVTVVAAVEFVGLVALGIALLGNPLAGIGAGTAKAAAAPRARRTVRTVVQPARLPRARTIVMVLNGNGRTGAAAAAAARVRAHGYRIGTVGNAARTDYTRTLVMYRPGFSGEAGRLARDLHVGIATPLDGMRPAQLHGAQLVLVVGA